jgi:hypothetical protein
VLPIYWTANVLTLVDWFKRMVGTHERWLDLDSAQLHGLASGISNFNKDKGDLLCACCYLTYVDRRQLLPCLSYQLSA